jgi:nitrilase
MKEDRMQVENYTIAVVQASPVFMDRDATVEKACTLIAEAAENRACIALFPEVFIPGFPDWVWYVPPIKIALNQKLYATLLEQAVTVPGPATDRLCQAAKEAGIYVAMGINERNSDKSGGSLYNSVLYIDPDGRIIGCRQKLVPTAPERTVWAYGDPATHEVYETKIGKIGGLTCWENYMPLARYNLYEQGIELYLAPTYDEGSTWQASMRHIGKEGRTYVASCCMAYKKEALLARFGELEPYYADAGEWINAGNSMITDPNGEILAGPLNKEEGILYAKVDLRMLRGSKWNLDVAGHYARPDAFGLCIWKRPEPFAARKQHETDTEGSVSAEKPSTEEDENDS